MNGPGKILQQARLDKDLTIDKVHKDTKIKQEYLEAIENDDVSGFPAELYYKNFLKSYAKYLHLVPEEMVNIYEQVKIEKQRELEELNRTYGLKERFAAFYKRNKKKLTIAFVCILVLLIAAVIMQVLNNIEMEFLTQDINDGQRYALQENETKVPAEPAADVDGQPKEEQEQPAVEEKEKKIEILTLDIKAKYGTWVRIISDEKIIFEDFLQKGQNFSAKAKNAFTLKIGNIEGVEVYFNNKKVNIAKGANDNRVNTITLNRADAQKQ